MELAGQIMVTVGAIIALTGLVLLVIVFREQQRRKGGAQATDDVADIIKKVLDLIEKWTPKLYRVPMLLLVIGVATMAIGLGILAGDSDSGDSDEPTTSTTVTTTG